MNEKIIVIENFVKCPPLFILVYMLIPEISIIKL